MDSGRTSMLEQGVGPFTLVPARCALRTPSQQEIVLRPKTFAVLNELLAHRGQVVTRESLLAAVWPNVTVSDESVTQCVRELRAALGPEGSAMLRTLPRRGYMLDLAGSGSRAVDADARAAPGPEPRAPALRRGWSPALALGALAGLGLAAWYVTATDPPQAVHASVPSQAEQLTDRADHWYRSEASPAAWRGQRDLYARATAADGNYARAWIGLALTNANLVHYRHSDAPAADLQAAQAAAERAFALAPNSAEANAALGAVDRLHPERLEQSLAALQR